MTLTDLIAGGGANPLLLIAMAFLLGAFHGLEPGHSKTMMAAYIIAIRGTIPQAILLGVSAAISHSLIVWVLAILGLLYGDELIGEQMEPYFMIASGVIIACIGLWIFRQSMQARAAGHHHDHAHGHRPHSHAHNHQHDHVHPHEPGHSHHDHTHILGETHDHDQPAREKPEFMDAHAMAHAREIEARIGSGRTSTWQTILFGLSGGLIPCPAAITVLLLCIQLGQFMLGIGLVASFSIGLAVTLVAIGVVAAVGMRYVSKKGSSRFDAILKKAPYISAAFIGLIGLFMIYSGWAHMHGHDGDGEAAAAPHHETL